MPAPIRFGFNHMLAPQLSVPDFLAFSHRHGVAGVELRNDVPGLQIDASSGTGLSAAETRRELEQHGLALLSINALQRFNHWNHDVAREARALIAFAAEAGGAAVVLCPINDPADRAGAAERERRLVAALRQLLPILRDHDIIGLVEPLGFAACSLRFKADAVRAIDAAGGADTFRLVHDTFHHHVASEPEIFPAATGLVHVSGVSDPSVRREAMRDPHRVLVDDRDRLGNVAQLRALRTAGYGGFFSFEPFAAELRGHPELDRLLAGSMALLEQPDPT